MSSQNATSSTLAPSECYLTCPCLASIQSLLSTVCPVRIQSQLSRSSLNTISSVYFKLVYHLSSLCHVSRPSLLLKSGQYTTSPAHVIRIPPLLSLSCQYTISTVHVQSELSNYTFVEDIWNMWTF